MVLTPQQLEAQMPDASQLYSNEPEMESSLHYMQLLLLVTCLEWLWREQTDFFIGANLTIYFSRQELRSRDFRGPDFFLVKNTIKLPRRSWVVWEEEGRYPDLIIELLSESTAATDQTLKKTLYQDHFRTPEYFWFSPTSLEFAGFRLAGGQYQEIAPNDIGWRWSETLNLYLGVDELGKLRYFTQTGHRLPTPEEAAVIAKAEAEREQLNAAQARLDLQREQLKTKAAEEQAQRLADRLRSLGINSD